METFVVIVSSSTQSLNRVDYPALWKELDQIFISITQGLKSDLKSSFVILKAYTDQMPSFNEIKPVGMRIMLLELLKHHIDTNIKRFNCFDLSFSIQVACQGRDYEMLGSLLKHTDLEKIPFQTIDLKDIREAFDLLKS